MSFNERLNTWRRNGVLLALSVALAAAGAACGGSGGGSSDDGNGNDNGNSNGGTSTAECATCHDAGALSGAHAAHVSGGTSSAGMACTECHQDRTTSHASVALTVKFGTLANTTDLILTPDATADRSGTATAATFDATAKTCSNVYCHGATLDGATGAATTPAWTSGTALTCTSCHADPPSLDGFHPTSTSATACAACHPTTVDSTGAVLASGGKHVDGTVEYEGSLHPSLWTPVGHNASIDFSTCTVCHADGRSCSSCH